MYIVRQVFASTEWLLAYTICVLWNVLRWGTECNNYRLQWVCITGRPVTVVNPGSLQKWLHVGFTWILEETASCTSSWSMAKKGRLSQKLLHVQAHWTIILITLAHRPHGKQLKLSHSSIDVLMYNVSLSQLHSGSLSSSPYCYRWLLAIAVNYVTFVMLCNMLTTSDSWFWRCKRQVTPD